MKKRVRILVSLLMISGSLTLTSKSYAEEGLSLNEERVFANACSIGVLGIFGGILVDSFILQRASKIGFAALKQARRSLGVGDGIILGGLALSTICILVLSVSVASASEIVENPALAMEDENFRFLAEVVGTELAFSSVEQIAKGEDPETVMSSLASSLEENSNAEEEHFLDLGNEENID